MRETWLVTNEAFRENESWLVTNETFWDERILIGVERSFPWWTNLAREETWTNPMNDEWPKKVSMNREWANWSKNGDESLEFRIKICFVYIHLQQKLSRESLLIPILSLDSSSRRFWLALESILMQNELRFWWVRTANFDSPHELFLLFCRLLFFPNYTRNLCGYKISYAFCCVL